MKFRLLTTVSWETSHTEPNSEETFTDEFNAKDKAAAVLRAEKLVEGHHETNRDRWDADYHISAELVQLVWTTKFVPAEEGQPAIPASPAHFKEAFASAL